MTPTVVIDQTWNPYLLAWMREHLGDSGDFDPEECRTIASVLFHENGNPEVLAVVAINRWTPRTCELTIATDKTRRWQSPEFFHAVYHYVFEHAKKLTFIASTRESNQSALKMHRRLGHSYVGRIEDAFGDGIAAELFQYTRKQWLAGPWATPEGEAHGHGNEQPANRHHNADA